MNKNIAPIYWSWRMGGWQPWLAVTGQDSHSSYSLHSLDLSKYVYVCVSVCECVDFIGVCVYEQVSEWHGV